MWYQEPIINKSVNFKYFKFAKTTNLDNRVSCNLRENYSPLRNFKVKTPSNIESWDYQDTKKCIVIAAIEKK